MTLSMFVKEKLKFRDMEIWVWVQSWKRNLTLHMSKYDFEYVCQRKIDSRYEQIWLWVFLLKEKLTFNICKYDFEYIYQKKSWL
jgi:hypothetical protein